MRSIYFFAINLLVCVLSAQVYADDKVHQSVDDLLAKNSIRQLMSMKVDTAAKVPEKIALSPALISVITAEDMALFGYQSVAEALSHVAGFVEADDLVTHNFGVRGVNAGLRAGSRTIKFLINGQASAYRSDDQNFIGAEFIPLDLIERIEIIKGPVSALYGANAFVGVVNIITRTGRRFKRLGNQVGVSVGYGANGRFSRTESLSLGGHKRRWDYSLGIQAGQADRSGLDLPRSSPFYAAFDPSRGNHLQTTQTDDSRPFSLYGRLRYDDKPHQQSLQLSAYFQQLNSTQNFSDLNPLPAQYVSQMVRNNAFLRLEAKKSWDRAWEGRVFATYAYGQPGADDRVEVGALDYYLQQDQAFYSVDLGLELVYNPLNKKNVFLFGWDFNHDRQRLAQFRQVLRGDGVSTVLNDRLDKTLINQGLYVQWQHHWQQPWLWAKWHSTLGLRYDRNSHHGNHQAWRLGLVAEFDDQQVVKLLLGTAFQAPSAELLFRKAVQAGDIIGNDNLAVQQATTLELNWLYPFNDVMYLSSTLFMTTMQDLVSFQRLEGNISARNGVSSYSRGLEMELQYRDKHWQAYANFLWQFTHFDEDPLILYELRKPDHATLFPSFSANLGISYRWKKHSLAFNSRFVGKRSASLQNISLLQRYYQLDEYVDSSLTWRYSGFSLLEAEKASVQVQIRDLWDSRYVTPGFGGIDIPSQGRRIIFSFQQRF